MRLLFVSRLRKPVKALSGTNKLKVGRALRPGRGKARRIKPETGPPVLLRSNALQLISTILSHESRSVVSDSECLSQKVLSIEGCRQSGFSEYILLFDRSLFYTSNEPLRRAPFTDQRNMRTGGSMSRQPPSGIENALKDSGK
jgi:hypothetical protein